MEQTFNRQLQKQRKELEIRLKATHDNLINQTINFQS